MLTIEEQAAVQLWEEASKAEWTADDSVGEVFRKGYQPMLDKGDYAGAWEYIKQMPDCTSKIYARDHIRTLRGDYKK